MSDTELDETILQKQLKRKEAHRLAMKKYFQSDKGKVALKKASKKYYLKKKETLKNELEE